MIEKISPAGTWLCSTITQVWKRLIFAGFVLKFIDTNLLLLYAFPLPVDLPVITYRLNNPLDSMNRRGISSGLLLNVFYKNPINLKRITTD